LHEKSPPPIRHKDDIEIPDPGPQTISHASRILAAIMAPNDRPSRIHGLHGKKLMYGSIMQSSRPLPCAAIPR